MNNDGMVIMYENEANYVNTTKTLQNMLCKLCIQVSYTLYIARTSCAIIVSSYARAADLNSFPN